jgi:hypothetical protein
MVSRVPRKPRTKKPKLTRKQKARKRRIENTAYRLIARENNITIKEAKRQFKDGIIEVIFSGPKRTAQRRFIEISPHKFREVPKGKPLKETEATGPVRSVGYVNRVIKLKRYWNFVHIMAEEMDLPVGEVRDRIKKGVIDLIEIYKFYFVPKEEKTA